MFVVNGSLSAGGPLPAPCVHTCDVSHQHLLSPPHRLYRPTCDCVSHWQNVAAQGQPKRSHSGLPGLSKTQDFEQVRRAGWWRW